MNESQQEPGDAEADSRAVIMPAEIGGYRIQRVLGAGGMATVYAAMQKQPRRVVALKVMKAGVSTARGDAAHRRFKREIEILGKLRHPYIAQVYGAGMHEESPGQAVPFFVMEYVPGAKTIMEFIAARQLDVRERLKLFVKVCAAIEHGHRHKVIHRDLKPANILIDEAGEPKVIDFGVAQAAELDVSSQTMHTEAGRLVGTLQYMSPEQLDSTLHDLDARCDVYALGVLLYKMLTGKPPHDLEALPVYEAVRVIREESPTKPSEAKPEVFRGNFRGGDLETIVLKAMEPERNRRYRTAGSLGRDVVRFLADEPIHARRASALYRTGLFARRHRTPIISGGIVASIMGAALAIVLIDRQNNRRSPATSGPIDPIAATATDGTPAEGDTTATELAPRSEFALRLHIGTVTALAFSPDGKRLASSAHDRSIVIWDLGTRQAAAIITDLNTAMKQLCFSADGRWLAAAGDRGPARLIDTQRVSAGATIATRTIMATGSGDGGFIRAMAMNGAGDHMGIALDDYTLRLVATDGSPDQGALIMRSATGALTCAAFSQGGGFIAAGSQRGTLYVWDTATGELVEQLGGLNGEILVTAISADISLKGEAPARAGDPAGDDSSDHLINRLAAVAADGSAMSWPLIGDDPYPATAFRVGREAIDAAAIDPTGRWLACAIGNGVRVWNIAAFSPWEVEPGVTLTEITHAVAIDPEGRWCAAGGANGDIAVLPIESAR